MMNIPERLAEYDKQLGDHSDVRSYELLSLCRELYKKYEDQRQTSEKFAEEIVRLKKIGSNGLIDSCAVCRGECYQCNRGLKCYIHSQPYEHQKSCKASAVSHIVCKKVEWFGGLARIEYEKYRLSLDKIIGWSSYHFNEGSKSYDGSKILTEDGIIYTDANVSRLDSIMEGR